MLPDLSDPARWLGRSAEDPAVVDLMVRLKLPRAPGVIRDPREDPDLIEVQDWLPNRHLGIELGFEDAGTFLGHHPDDHGEEGMLLTQIYFYGDHPRMAPFRAPLPLGLSLQDDRPAVRARLSAWEDRRRSWRRDCWDLPGYRLTAGYAGDGQRLGFVLCALPAAPQPADPEEAARAPAAPRMAEKLGAPLSDPGLLRALAPLDWQAELADEGGGILVADFSDTLGLELRFQHLRGSGEPLLSRILFFGDGNFDTVRWPGRLPFDIRFGDSPDRMLARVGTAPRELVEFEDGSFIAYATWALGRGTLLVEFDAMANLILRLHLLAPGMDPDQTAEGMP